MLEHMGVGALHTRYDSSAFSSVYHLVGCYCCRDIRSRSYLYYYTESQIFTTSWLRPSLNANVTKVGQELKVKKLENAREISIADKKTPGIGLCSILANPNPTKQALHFPQLYHKKAVVCASCSTNGMANSQ